MLEIFLYLLAVVVILLMTWPKSRNAILDALERGYTRLADGPADTLDATHASPPALVPTVGETYYYTFIKGLLRNGSVIGNTTETRRVFRVARDHTGALVVVYGLKDGTSVTIPLSQWQREAEDVWLMRP